MEPRKRSESKASKVKVLLVDDHPIVRVGLTELINQQTNFMVCGTAEDAHTALESIAELTPDIVIVDITLKQGNGLELIKDIKVRHPGLAVLVVSMHDESLYAERVLHAGAMGYIMKQELTDKVAEAIQKVLNGEIYLSDRMSAKILRRFVGNRPEASGSMLENLGDRELQVFQLIGQGHGRVEIAAELNLSVKTVDTYRENIKRKLNLRNSTELVQQAIQWAQGVNKV